MTNSLLNFLGHGGLKLFVISAFLLIKMAKASAKKAKQNEAQVRGNTRIDDFSAPEAKPLASSPLFSKGSAPSPTSSLGSPWSSNQNPFDNSKQ